MAGVAEETAVTVLSEATNTIEAPTHDKPAVSPAAVLSRQTSDLGDDAAAEAAAMAAMPLSVESEVQEERLQARRHRIAKRREDARRKAAGCVWLRFTAVNHELMA